LASLTTASFNVAPARKATCMGLVLVLREKAPDVDDGVSARDCVEMITLRSQSGDDNPQITKVEDDKPSDHKVEMITLRSQSGTNERDTGNRHVVSARTSCQVTLTVAYNSVLCTNAPAGDAGVRPSSCLSGRFL